MLYKGLVLAAAVTATYVSGPAGAHPGSAGYGLEAGDGAAIRASYYYSGYDYAGRRWNSGYGSVRPSFWGYPALLLPNEPKVLATADQIQAVEDYREGLRQSPYYDEPDFASVPGTWPGSYEGAYGYGYRASWSGDTRRYYSRDRYDYDRPANSGYEGYRPGYYSRRPYYGAGYERWRGYGTGYPGYYSGYRGYSEYSGYPGYFDGPSYRSRWNGYEGTGYGRGPGGYGQASGWGD